MTAVRLSREIRTDAKDTAENLVKSWANSGYGSFPVDDMREALLAFYVAGAAAERSRQASKCAKKRS